MRTVVCVFVRVCLSEDVCIYECVREDVWCVSEHTYVRMFIRLSVCVYV